MTVIPAGKKTWCVVHSSRGTFVSGENIGVRTV